VAQLTDIFSGVHDVGTITFAPTLAIPATTGITLTPQTGTVLGIGAYQYAVTYISGYYNTKGVLMKTGETPLSSALSITTVSGTTTVKITLPTTGLPASAVAFGLYRTAVAGATYGLIATVQFGNAYYTDSTADASRGAVPPTINTTGVCTKQALTNSYWTYDCVAAYENKTSPLTGTIKITLPYSWTNTMMTISITGYDYSSNGTWKLALGGYNYSTTPSWVNTSATLDGAAPFSSVRFGHDGTYCCILLGITTTVWNYPFIKIDDINVGFGGTTNDWSMGWQIGVITAETGITVTSTPTINLGLNADTTDGYHMNQDVRSTASPTFAGATVTGLVNANGGITIPAGKTTTINGPMAGAYAANGDITGAVADLNGAQFAVATAAPAGTTVDPFGVMTGGGANAVKSLVVNKSGNVGMGIAPTTGVHILGGGGLKVQALSVQLTPTVAPQGTAGTTSYTYYVVATDRNGNRTLASSPGTTTTGNATLSGTNYNKISWTAVAGAVSYDILKGNFVTAIATGVTALTINDTGQAATGYSLPIYNNTGDIWGGGAIYSGSNVLDDGSGNQNIQGNITLNGNLNANLSIYASYLTANNFQHGTAGCPISGAGQWRVDVTFPKAFGQYLNVDVVASVNNSLAPQYYAQFVLGNLSKTGFSFVCSVQSGGTAPSVGFSWFAIAT
jgi:hypothetical protein